MKIYNGYKIVFHELLFELCRRIEGSNKNDFYKSRNINMNKLSRKIQRSLKHKIKYILEQSKTPQEDESDEIDCKTAFLNED